MNRRGFLKRLGASAVAATPATKVMAIMAPKIMGPQGIGNYGGPDNPHVDAMQFYTYFPVTFARKVITHHCQPPKLYFITQQEPD